MKFHRTEISAFSASFYALRDAARTRRGLCLRLAALALLCALCAGCMANNPNETDMPWAAPEGWEGTMPLPGFYNRGM